MPTGLEFDHQEERTQAMNSYVIRGGTEGRKRLALLARTLWPTTSKLLRSAGLEAGMHCLDLGCGGGDVSLEMAKWVGAGGSVVGLDMDGAKLELAREEAGEQELANIEFRRADAHSWAEVGAYDFVYCRFLLTHLKEPQPVLGQIWRALRPGGRALLEDIDFSGHVCHPPCTAFERYQQLYRQVVHRRGGDADIGPKLFRMAKEANWQSLEIEVVQPVFVQEESREMAIITLENIADAVLGEGLASAQELDSILEELRAFTKADDTLLSLPRIFQLRARAPGKSGES